MDYETEKEKMANFKVTDFWKPEPGQYKIKALTELEEAEPFKREGEPDRPQVKVKILIEGKEEHNWTMAKGKTLSSTYGQLCNLATSNKNKLKDLEFMVVVTSDGTKNTYAIVKL